MSEITYRDLTGGNVEECRELCNELMRFQAERSHKYTAALAAMNFDNRLKPAFDAAEEKFLCVAYDENRPVGYIFCEAFVVTEAIKNFRFDWVNLPATANGLYPAELPVPVKAAHLNNIYVKPNYRGLNIGKTLLNRGMEWLKNARDAEYIFVHVSNGNTAAALYEKYGFAYSHSAFDGMIDAYSMRNPVALKKSLRRQILSLRKSLSPPEISALSSVIVQKFLALPLYQKSRTLMAYASMPEEVQLLPLFLDALSQKKSLAIPLITAPREMLPVLVPSLDALEPDKFGIPTVKKNLRKLVDADKIDCVIVPGAAFDTRGNRLGLGGGFYDNFLPKIPNATKIALAFDFQIVPTVPAEPHDAPVDIIVTENRIITAERS